MANRLHPKKMDSLLGGIKLAQAGGGNMGGIEMRGQGGIKIMARDPSGLLKPMRIYSGYYALVVGCSEYTRGWPRLPNPVNDAEAVAKMLSSLGWQVDLVKNPDGAGLRRAFNRVIAGPGKDPDRAVLVWFSGHGHTMKEADDTKLGYLVPVDAPLPQDDEMGFLEKALDMRRVETLAKRVQAKHVMMLFDSCFSGALFSLVRAAPAPHIQAKSARPVRQFITAGNENEKVPDRSIFKTVFMQGITDKEADRNRDGYITGEELGAYLQDKVMAYSREAQHPQYGKINNPKLDKGDFVIKLPGASMQAASTAAKQSPAARTALAGTQPLKAEPKRAISPAAPPGPAATAAKVPPAAPVLASKAAPPESVSSEIKAALAAQLAAWNSRNRDELFAHYGEGAMIMALTKGGVATLNKRRFTRYFTKMMENLADSDFSLSRSDISLTELKAGRVMVQANGSFTSTGRGFDRRYTERIVLKKIGDRWLIVRYFLRKPSQ